MHSKFLNTTADFGNCLNDFQSAETNGNENV